MIDPSSPATGPAAEDRRRPVFLFCHIPKCAGSTVKQHMQNNAPERTAMAKRRHGFLRDLGGDYTDIQRSGIDPQKVDFVGGHALSGSVAKAFPGRPVQPCVLIRDPLSFSVSFYNHRNRQAAKIGRGPVSFELYVKSLPKNPMTRFLMTRFLGIGYPNILKYDSSERFRLVDETLSTFWFVGSWRHASELIGGLAAELNIPDIVQIKNAAYGERLRPDDISEDLARHIRSVNTVDQTLFERWADVKWSGDPRQIDVQLPSGDQGAYVANEIIRQVTGRYIKTIRPKL